MGAAARPVGGGRACLGTERGAAVPLRRRHPRPLSGGDAAADPGGDGRAPAHAAGGASVPRSPPDPRLGARGLRRGHRLGDAVAQFSRSGDRPPGGGLHRRRGIPLADADRPHRDQLARRAGPWDVASVNRRVVARAGEPSAVPVPAAPLVFPAVDLDAVPVAGVAHPAEPHADPSGPLRRPGLPRPPSGTPSRRCSWPRGRCWPV